MPTCSTIWIHLVITPLYSAFCVPHSGPSTVRYRFAEQTLEAEHAMRQGIPPVDHRRSVENHNRYMLKHAETTKCCLYKVSAAFLVSCLHALVCSSLNMVPASRTNQVVPQCQTESQKEIQKNKPNKTDRTNTSFRVMAELVFAKKEQRPIPGR